ncbi:MAG: diguanylate cyclase (GGDEF)-like protein [Sulfurimonas sp.]|jgi:diguanylate cyclase (GGDEF)-like protein
MISYQEKKRLIVKIIIIVVMSLVVLSVIRFFLIDDEVESLSSLYYSLIFKEFCISFSSALFILAVLYLFTKKDFIKFNHKAVSYAYTDALTGLKNRHHLKKSLEDFKVIGTQDSNYAVVFIDIDRFKLVNDTFGHSTGDCVLKSLANNLQSAIRPGDTLCRYGGEEFVIIFCNIFKEDAINRTEQIRSSVETKTFNCIGQKITISAGISFGSSGDDIKEIMENSDKALYRAKNAGRNCVKVFDATK